MVAVDQDYCKALPFTDPDVFPPENHYHHNTDCPEGLIPALALVIVLTVVILFLLATSEAVIW